MLSNNNIKLPVNFHKISLIFRIWFCLINIGFLLLHSDVWYCAVETVDTPLQPSALISIIVEIIISGIIWFVLRRNRRVNLSNGLTVSLCCLLHRYISWYFSLLRYQWEYRRGEKHWKQYLFFPVSFQTLTCWCIACCSKENFLFKFL